MLELESTAMLAMWNCNNYYYVHNDNYVLMFSSHVFHVRILVLHITLITFEFVKWID